MINNQLKFFKYHGTGNDFVIINFLEQDFNSLTQEVIVKTCKRNFGVGADGILAVLPSKTADYKMRIFNSDGSEPEMCGNGIRCFVKYLYDNNLMKNDIITIETLAGIKSSKTYTQDSKLLIEVSMGPALFKDEKLFYDSYLSKEISGGEKFTSVSMGNPHMIILKDKKIDLGYLKKRGAELVDNEFFLNGTNVEFLTLKNDKELDMMVYERGAGITLACGTGACASVAALVKLGKSNFDNWVKVNLLGGVLEIMVKSDYEDVLLKGEAEFVFSGQISI